MYENLSCIVDRAILKTKLNFIYHRTLRCYILWVAIYKPAYTELWTTPSYGFYAFINIIFMPGWQCVGR